MYEWHVVYSITSREGDRISFKEWSAIVDAESEEEVREVIEEDLPGAHISKIVRGAFIGD